MVVSYHVSKCRVRWTLNSGLYREPFDGITQPAVVWRDGLACYWNRFTTLTTFADSFKRVSREQVNQYIKSLFGFDFEDAVCRFMSRTQS